MGDDEGYILDRFNYNIGLTTNFNLGKVIPGVLVRIPTNKDVRDLADAVFGLSLRVPMQ